MIPSIKRSILGVSLLLSFAASSYAQLLSVDFNSINNAPPSPTLTGFQAFNIDRAVNAARTASFTASDSSIVTVILPNGATSSRDRGAVAGTGSFTYSDLYRDLAVQIAYPSPAAGGATPTLAAVNAVTSLKLTGLSLSTDYTIRLWSVNPGNDNNSVFEWFNNTPQTFTMQGSEASLGTITNKSTPAPTSNTDYSVFGTVRTNQSGELYFRHSATAGTGSLNGFELTAIPEPSTVMALVVGGALVLVVHRRRTAV